jgi:hypothetical protein
MQNRKTIETFNLGQLVESTDLRISGWIINIMSRKKTVRIRYWNSRVRYEKEVPFGSLFSVKKMF